MNQNELLRIKNKSNEIINLIDEIDENGLIILLTKSEKLTLDIRKFVIENYKNDNSNSFEKALIISNGVDISVNKNGIISIDMPPILPFKKVKNIRRSYENVDQSDESTYRCLGKLSKLGLDEIYIKTNTILEPLGLALNQIQYYNRKISTLVFTNFYENGRAFPDPDNFEYKQIIDVVTDKLCLNDDSNIKIVIQNKSSNKCYTNLKVIPKALQTNQFGLVDDKAIENTNKTNNLPNSTNFPTISSSKYSSSVIGIMLSLSGM